MCWACDHPQATGLDYLDHLRDIIARYGWAVQHVERAGIRPPYAYTVGLTPHGRPELMVTGLSAARAAGLLNDVASHVLHAAAPEPGEQIQLCGGPLIEIVQVAEPTAHLVVAVSLYGPGVRALQVVYADDRRHWPWDRRFRGGRGGQPVLGTRTRIAAPHTGDDPAR